MAVFYLDTSALVKRYKTEEGSEAVDHLYENLPAGSVLATSFLTVLVCFCYAATGEGKPHLNRRI